MRNPATPHIHIAILVTFLYLLPVVAAFGQEDSERGVILNPPVIDFGRFENELFEESRTFYVENDSFTDFEIEAIYAGCGCISTRLIGPSTIRPGNRSQVKVTISGKKANIGAKEYKLIVIPRDKSVAPLWAVARFNYDPPIQFLGREFQIEGRTDHQTSEAGIASASVQLVDRSRDQSLEIVRILSSNPFPEWSACNVAV